MIQILNLPDKHRKYIVARIVVSFTESTWWYYGSYDTEEEAYSVAQEIGGQVFHRPNYIISTIIDPTATMGMRTEIEEE